MWVSVPSDDAAAKGVIRLSACPRDYSRTAAMRAPELHSLEQKMEASEAVERSLARVCVVWSAWPSILCFEKKLSTKQTPRWYSNKRQAHAVDLLGSLMGHALPVFNYT